ncbi:hypothetical protein LTR10_019266 [Elasticomyces elasticus]|uniref:Major facilitator superfamily (MFS) profile domain-containing protein n=1 Tax=Exophiala sideris TaxID=1016849 RepID=A0ABR0IWW8_9EURO|nr:hypothetical protein LTR10_019266 [Elasticomyces elasticus]KAK5021944.1 hypothetical protein LTS07_010526 [Exophiala sideris]KAK5026007.1 hypothetical protein LTR13_010164 [Exophiala sideris]KAK5050694.1 hypothetical protein LTR69_010550 [Exophiala sideris]KAK5177179.1 hypothetical protein LTR44_010307 [Eurotiomycetes sp. CCFEE 6388]
MSDLAFIATTSKTFTPAPSAMPSISALNQSIFLEDIGFAGGKDPWHKLWKIAVGNIIVQLAGWMPGVYMGVFLPDILGRRVLQCGTCVLACVFFAIWAGVSDVSSSGGLIALFTLSQFALACGPNVTTFLIPAEVFPTRVRGTAHGISAASGKAGALLTAYSFATATKQIGLRGVLGLLAGILFLVALVTLLIPEPKGKTLDEIENGALYRVRPQTHALAAGGSEPSDTEVVQVAPKAASAQDNSGMATSLNTDGRVDC